MSDYSSEFSIRRLWIIFGVSMVIMFGALLYFGVQIYHAKPPMPAAVRTVSGQILYTGDDIQRGQAVWQSTGGMQQGSIWGHGGYVAPDWSADWLHREALALRDELAGTGAGAVRGAGGARSGADRRHPQARNAHQRLRSADLASSPSATSAPPPSRRPPPITATCSPTARPPTSICASSTRCRKTPC